MPYEWTTSRPEAPRVRQLNLWPYRSLLRRDFAVFIGATAALVLLPLLTVLGTAILWGLLPFFALMLAGIWFALHVSYRRGEVLEELTFDETRAMLIRHNPNGDTQEWSANRYWITVHLHPTGGPVENYVTLRGNNREVEIGAFLDAEERLALYNELKSAFRDPH